MEKRTFTIDIGSIRSTEDRTVEATLSSTFPVRRYDGDEVLEHAPESIDLSRQPLPLITSHDTSSLPVGVVEQLRIVGDKMKGLLRISSTKEDIWKDIKDGILRNLSIGYFVRERKKTSGGYLVTKWQPYEVSLVAAGADPAAGIGRSVNTTQKKESKSMDVNDILKAKKRAADELAQLAGTENLDETGITRMDELKVEIRRYDMRLEAADLAKKSKDDLAQRDGFTPEIKKQDRGILTAKGGPAADRSYAGMFGRVEIVEDDIKAFHRTMTEGVPSAGGFSVPEPLAAKWLDDALPSEIIRPRAQVWPMTAATLKAPGWDGADQSAGAYFGGLAMEFLAENGTATPQDAALRLITLSAKKGAIFVNISNELREDGNGFEAQLEAAMKKSLSLGMDYYFLRGLGGGQPLGILSDPAIISVAKEAGQAATTLVFENISKMFARHYTPNQAIWICNPNCIPQLLQLTIAIGTGGSHIPVLNETAGSFTLLGRPVVFSTFMPTLGAANDIILVDPSQYAIGLRKDLRLEKSNVPGWTQDLMSYRVIVRMDGMGTWSAPITPRNGSTLSWVVGLAVRA